jgi:hypothetical protein
MDPRDHQVKAGRQRQKQALLDKAYDQLIESQLKVIAEKKTTTDKDEERYKEELAKARELALASNASKRKRREDSATSTDDGIHASGLSGS